jgi:hypothetical protein
MQVVLRTLAIETSPFMALSRLFSIMNQYGWNGIAQLHSVEISNTEFQQNKHYEIYRKVDLWPYVLCKLAFFVDQYSNFDFHFIVSVQLHPYTEFTRWCSLSLFIIYLTLHVSAQMTIIRCIKL